MSAKNKKTAEIVHKKLPRQRVRPLGKGSAAPMLRETAAVARDRLRKLIEIGSAATPRELERALAECRLQAAALAAAEDLERLATPPKTDDAGFTVTLHRLEPAGPSSTTGGEPGA